MTAFTSNIPLILKHIYAFQQISKYQKKDHIVIIWVALVHMLTKHRIHKLNYCHKLIIPSYHIQVQNLSLNSSNLAKIHVPKPKISSFKLLLQQQWKRNPNLTETQLNPHLATLNPIQKFHQRTLNSQTKNYQNYSFSLNLLHSY